MEAISVETAAEMVERSRAEGIEPPAELKERLTFDQAYQVQDRLLDWFRARGEVQSGWKIGANSDAARELFKVVDPFAGFILKRGEFRSGHRFDLAAIPGSPVLECELCIRMGRRLAGPEVTRDQVLDAVAGIAPAFEIAGIGREATVDPPLNIADDVAHWGYVLGEEISPYPRGLDLPTLVVRARRNGEVVFDNPCAGAIDVQLDSIAWLANHVAKSGRALEPGHLIITGSCTRPTVIQPGDRWEAQFAGVGEVTAAFD
jgi:2-keto-4-pentenoate hydratase